MESIEAPVEELTLKGFVPPTPCSAKVAIGEDVLTPSFVMLARLETYKFVDVTLVPVAVENVSAPLRLVTPETYKLVEVTPPTT